MSHETIPRQCVQLAEEIETLKEEVSLLKEEMAEAPPQMQAYYRREIKALNREIALREQQLRACEEQHNPPAQRPDLLAYGVRVEADHLHRKLRVAAIVKNIGKAAAAGPFRIDMAVTEKIGNTTVSHVQVFQVPSSVVIAPQPVVDPNPTALAIVGGTTPTFTYVTGKMEVPLRYIDESPSTRYEIEFLVDSEQVLSESNESNNRYFGTRWFSSPAALERETPFLIKSDEMAHAAGAD